MKNTQVLGALGLSLVLTLAGSQYIFAQEATPASNSTLDQAIDNALAAQEVARKAQENGSVRGRQINEYIAGLIEYTNGDVVDMVELTEALNDAANSTQLLLNMEAQEANVRAQESTTRTNSTATHSDLSARETTRTNKTTTSDENAAGNTDLETIVATPATAIKLEVKSEEDAGNQNKKVTPAKVSETVGVKIDGREEPSKQPQVKTATPEKVKITTAEAKTVAENQATENNDDSVDVPATGESQNQIGKIIAIGVAAVIAAVGAIAIVLKVKRDA